MATTSPSDGEEGVPIAPVSVSLTFDADIVAGFGSLTVRRASDGLLAADVGVPGSGVSISGDTLVIDLKSALRNPLQSGTEYELTLSAGAVKGADDAADPIDEVTSSFTTVGLQGCADLLSAATGASADSGVHEVRFGSTLFDTYCDVSRAGDRAWALLGYGSAALGGDLRATSGSWNAASRSGSATLPSVPVVQQSPALAFALADGTATPTGGLASYSVAYSVDVPSPGDAQMYRESGVGQPGCAAEYSRTAVRCVGGDCNSYRVPSSMFAGTRSLVVNYMRGYGAVEPAYGTNAGFCDWSPDSQYFQAVYVGTTPSSAPSVVAYAPGSTANLFTATRTSVWALSMAPRFSCEAHRVAPLRDLALWWRLDALREDGVLDYSGRGADGNPSGMRVQGGGVYFDNGGYVATEEALPNLVGDATFAVAAWIYWDGEDDFGGSNSYPCVWSVDYSPGLTVNKGAYLTAGSTSRGAGTLAFGFWSTRVVATKKIEAKKWYHVVASKQSGTKAATAKLYVNGEQVTTVLEADNSVTDEGTIDAAPDIQPAPFQVGRLRTSSSSGSPAAFRWKGFIQDVRVYTDAHVPDPSALGVGGNDAGALGASQENPAETCADILVANPDAPDGVYWIRVGASYTRVHCDMTTDGGGWALVAVARYANRGQGGWNSEAALNPSSSTNKDAHWHFSSADITAMAGREEYRATCFASNNNYQRYWWGVSSYKWGSQVRGTAHDGRYSRRRLLTLSVDHAQAPMRNRGACNSFAAYDQSGSCYVTNWAGHHWGLTSGNNERDTLLTSHSGNHWACAGNAGPGGEVRRRVAHSTAAAELTP